ncbi:MAG TPA: hypothetical protein DEB06_01525 [Phycisphaerales bacterium]|nr:hypothetical protein [Phycisphaerales bacterium]
MVLAGGGCVERRMVITSEPEGALVSLNDVEVGRTPLEVGFTYFGVYDIRLRREGYEPLVTSREAVAPLHEWPGVDLVAMAVPVRKSTVVRWHFTLEKSSEDRDALLFRALELQQMLDEGTAPPPAPPSPEPPSPEPPPTPHPSH